MNSPDITLDCDTDGSCDIRLNGDQIGVIEGTYTSISDVFIDPDHRNNGYGTAAVYQYLERAVENDVTRIQTTGVVHGAMESILESAGFTRCDHDRTHFECHVTDLELPSTEET